MQEKAQIIKDQKQRAKAAAPHTVHLGLFGEKTLSYKYHLNLVA